MESGEKLQYEESKRKEKSRFLVIYYIYDYETAAFFEEVQRILVQPVEVHRVFELKETEYATVESLHKEYCEADGGLL